MKAIHHNHTLEEECSTLNSSRINSILAMLIVNEEGDIEAHCVIPQSPRNRELLQTAVANLYDSLRDKKNEVRH